MVFVIDSVGVVMPEISVLCDNKLIRDDDYVI